MAASKRYKKQLKPVLRSQEVKAMNAFLKEHEPSHDKDTQRFCQLFQEIRDNDHVKKDYQIEAIRSMKHELEQGEEDWVKAYKTNVTTCMPDHLSQAITIWISMLQSIESKILHKHLTELINNLRKEKRVDDNVNEHISHAMRDQFQQLHRMAATATKESIQTEILRTSMYFQHTIFDEHLKEQAINNIKDLHGLAKAIIVDRQCNQAIPAALKLTNTLFHHANTQIKEHISELKDTLQQQANILEGIMKAPGYDKLVWQSASLQLIFVLQQLHPSTAFFYINLKNKTTEQSNQGFAGFFNTLTPFCQLMIVYAIYGNISRDALIEPQEGTQDTLLSHMILPLVMHHAHFAQDSNVLEHAANSLQQLFAMLTKLKGHAAKAWTDRYLEPVCENTMRIIYTHWHSKVSKVAKTMHTIFELVLQLTQRYHIKSIDTHAIVTQLVNLPSVSRGKYRLLKVLVNYIGVKTLFEMHPTLLSHMLQLLASNLMPTHIAEFYLHMAKLLKKEPETFHRLLLDPLFEFIFKSSATPQEVEVVIRYMIPRLFDLHPALITDALLHKILPNKDYISQHHQLHHVLHMLKLMKLMKPSKACLNPTQTVLDHSIDLIESCFTHGDESIQMLAIELITQSKLTAMIVSDQELTMVEFYLHAHFRNIEGQVRIQLMHTLKPFLTRIREHGQRIYKECKKQAAYEKKDIFSLNEPIFREHIEKLKRYQAFIAKSIQLCAEALYPGCPHEKKLVAIEYYTLLIDVYGHPQHVVPLCGFDKTKAPQQLFQTKLVHALFSSFGDCWDRIRMYVFNTLKAFPAPLPGFDNPTQLLNYAISLVSSPRVRDADAGALMIRLLHQKYVQQATKGPWRMDLMTGECVQDDKSNSLVFLQALVTRLSTILADVTKDVFALASTHSLVGTISALRYVIEDIPLNSPEVLKDAEQWRLVLKLTSKTLMECTGFAIQLLSDAKEDMLNFSTTIEGLNVDCRGHAYFDNTSCSQSDVHTIVVNGWLSVRETTLVIGTIVSQVPLGDQYEGYSPLISMQLIESFGELYMTILLSCKHNGVIDKTQNAFEMLSTKLLSTHLEPFRKLVLKWLNQLLDRITSKDSTILRRSAGLPFAFEALLKGETSKSSYPILKELLSKLIAIANPDSEHDAIPRVHALNILRHIIRNNVIGERTFVFVEESFIMALSGFESSNWAIRNSSLMLYTSLIGRVLGSATHRGQTTSAREFLAKYPTLRDYLYNKLIFATEKSTGHQLHPNLHPILLLISKMAPTSAFASRNLESHEARFVAPVKRCASLKHYLARAIAAKAIVSLVHTEAGWQTIVDLIQSIPSCTSANQIHGMLLQLFEFIQGTTLDAVHWYSLCDLLNKLVPVLLTTNVSVINMTFASLLHYVLDHFIKHEEPFPVVDLLKSIYQVATTSMNKVVPSKIADEQIHVGLSCDLEKLVALSIKVTLLPTVHVIHENTVNIVSNPLLHDTFKSVSLCLTINNIHARIAALQTLVDANTTFTTDAHLKPLLDTLMMSLQEETDAEYIKFALGALIQLLSIDSIKTFLKDPLALYDLLITIRERHQASPIIVSYCVEIFGLLLSMDDAVRDKHTACYLHWMKTFAQPETDIEIRLACVYSLAHANLFLMDPLNVTACIIASTFMQDDDVDIRDAMTLQIANMLKHRGIPELATRPFETYQTDYLLQLLHREMTKAALASKEAVSFFNHVASTLRAPKKDQGELDILFHSYTPQLFEKEEMNLFEEPLFQYQLAGQSYAKLLAALPLEAIQSSLEETAKEMLLIVQSLVDHQQALSQKYPSLNNELLTHAKVFYAIYPYMLWYQRVTESPHASFVNTLWTKTNPVSLLLSHFKGYHELLPCNDASSLTSLCWVD